jgi:outer membrane protein
MRRFSILLPVLLLLSLSSTAQALPGVGAGVRGTYWFPDLSATAQSTFGGVPETEFNLKDDLGMDDENFLSGEAFLRFGRVHFRVGYTKISYDGSATLSQDIEFNGQIFPVNDNVISSLDVKMLDAEVQVDILRPDFVAASFYLGLIGKVKYVDLDLELTSTTLTEKQDFQGPVPMVGLAAGAGFLNDLLRVDARVTGMAYSGNHLYEADGFVSLVPFPFLRIQGGYRYLDLKADEDDLRADVELKGPYVGAQLSF